MELSIHFAKCIEMVNERFHLLGRKSRVDEVLELLDVLSWSDSCPIGDLLQSLLARTDRLEIDFGGIAHGEDS